MQVTLDQREFITALQQAPWFQALCRDEMLPKRYPWIAMDKNCKVYIYTVRPRSGLDIWVSHDGSFLFLGQLTLSGGNPDFQQCCLRLAQLKYHRESLPPVRLPPHLPDIPVASSFDAWL